ncbi:MAG: ATP-binding protein [Phycisphaerales bacterium]|nr:ATP-binding protein [Phycisphaerales bacterium]MCI0630961.1 ATP-binding protein [Phycisphaerales bacterium]MCI0674324.1 ATP-binding protein [Phycisphaerales bacterium]
MSILERQRITLPGVKRAAENSAPMPSIPRADNVVIDDLRDLMSEVAHASQRLQATHGSLQDHVARLQRELADANAALRRSQALAALGQMAAGIAHEVRNPLGSIQLYVQMLAEDLADRPAQSELCAKIARAVVTLDAVVRDVLAFARDMLINPQPTTAQQLFERTTENCQSMLVGKVRVVRRLDWNREFQADIGLIVQALGNLVRNAVEAMEEASIGQAQLRLSATSRRIRCAASPPETRVVLAVEDSGPGIPPAVMDRIFNPFFTTRKTGTGLGLAIVHRIIDAHGGHLLIHNLGSQNLPPSGDSTESSVRGRSGTRVEICLPLNPAAASSASRGTERPLLEHPA